MSCRKSWISRPPGSRYVAIFAGDVDRFGLAGAAIISLLDFYDRANEVTGLPTSSRERIIADLQGIVGKNSIDVALHGLRELDVVLRTEKIEMGIANFKRNVRYGINTATLSSILGAPGFGSIGCSRNQEHREFPITVPELDPKPGAYIDIDKKEEEAAARAPARATDSAATKFEKRRTRRPSGIVTWLPADVQAAEALEQQYTPDDISTAVVALAAENKQPVPGLIQQKIEQSQHAHGTEERLAHERAVQREPYTPGSDDAAIEMLREIFGTAITHIVGGNTAGAESAAANMLGAAFGFFNGGVLFFGSILLTWITVFGLTNTANDGQVLGKKWSTFYTPLRTFTASAMLIPSTSGYSMVQLAILLIVTWSVGFASNMWGRVVDYVVDDTAIEQVMRSVVDDKQFDRVALNALQMQVCAYGVTRGINETMGQGTVNLQLYSWHQRINTGSTTTTYKTFLDFRDPKWQGSEEICGTTILTTTFTKPDTNRASVNQTTATLQDEIANVQGSIGNIRYKAAMDVFAKMAPQMNELIRVADSTGEKFSASRVQAVIDEAREAMLKDVRDEVSKRVGAANSGIKTKLKQGGWVMAGSLHRELLAIKDGIQKAMTSRHQYLPGTYTVDHILGGGGEVSSAVQLVMTRYTSLAGFVLQKLDQGAEFQTRKPTDMPKLRTGLGPEDFADGGTSVKSQVETWFNGLANWAMAGMVFYLGEDGTDPVMQIKNLGDWMAGFAETVMLTKATLTATVDGLFEGSKAAANQSVLGTNLAGLMSVGPGVLKFILTIIQELWSVVQPGVQAVLYGGYFLGMWIPMVPYYVFALGVIGWLVQVVESLAAGSLWMVMHLTPESDDSFIGSQKQGYLLLMSLFARPPLMVLGLVASMAILTPAVRFINASFMTSFRIIQADSITGLLSLGGFMLIYSVIILGVFLLVFSLPQTLPDRILRWVGAGISDMGEQNTMSRIESGASGQAKTAALAGAAGMARRTQDRKEKERDARRADTEERDEADGARPEGHTQ